MFSNQEKGKEGGRERVIEKSEAEKKREGGRTQGEVWMGSREKHRYN